MKKWVHLSEDKMQKALEFLNEESNNFDVGNERTDAYLIRPIRQRRTLSKQEEANRILSKMLQNDVIEKFNSLRSSPIVLAED